MTGNRIAVIINLSMRSTETFGWTEEKIQQAIATLASLPPPAQPEVKILEPEEVCACGKKVPIVSLEELDTGVFKTIGDVCKGCAAGHKLDREHAKIICARCKRVICRITPATDKTGFSFKAGKVYHLVRCGLCEPGVEQCQIIEKVLWDRSHKK